MKVRRVATPGRIEWIDSGIDTDRRTAFREPVFDSLVVVLEVIPEVAIRKWVPVIDVE
jgi:hypothetical protein